MTDASDDYRIEPMLLQEADYPALIAVIRDAFLANGTEEGGTIAFDEATFRLIFGSPFLPNDLFVRAVHVPAGKLVGFLGALPRKVAWGEKTLQLGVPAWLAVDPAHQRHGLAQRMGLELLELARDKGYDGGLAFFEPEAHGIDATRAVARDAGFSVHDVAVIRRFLIRALDVAAAARVVKLEWYEKVALRALQGLTRVRGDRVRAMRADDAPRLFELMADPVRDNELAVVRERDDFLWYLSQPEIECVVHEDSSGSPDGFMLAWPMQLAGFGNSVPFGWLDLVHTSRLAGRDAKDLAALMCRRARDRGWAGLQMPFIPYFDPKPLWRTRFVPFPKELSVTLLGIGNVELPRSVKRFYFDWR